MAQSKKKDKSNDDEEERPRVVKCPADLQRLRIEKLMKNPAKPVMIHERPKEKAMPNAPEFVRNVMGSSAGAGSGEFHVYRHLRRKEYARQKFIQEKSEKEKLNDQYHEKLENNKKAADERTAKKRAKRLKKKQNAKMKGKKPKIENKTSESENSDEDSDESTEEKDVTSDENSSDLPKETRTKKKLKKNQL